MSFCLRLKLCQQRPCDVLLLLVLEEGFKIFSSFLNYRTTGTKRQAWYIYIFCFGISSLYLFPIILLCFFSTFRTGVFWGSLPPTSKCSGRSPRAPFVRHDFLGGGCPERDLKMVVEEWRLWTGHWEGWWDDEGWWLRLQLLSLLVSKCQGLFFLLGSCRLKWSFVVDFFSGRLESFRSEPFWSISR